ncbi:unnamed protein product [Phyllotreta striolata]|uniref:histone acetyltransferase n=1 Tax=Phyllotreta striolata TaxID=444603 RepID=A0A9N9XNF6_PHYSR|nr:unnamed protein product [Phyllotreta striolata]
MSPSFNRNFMASENNSEVSQGDEEMSVYKKDANAVVTFHVHYGPTEKISKNSFKPIMSHQVFGENECIFGYRSLEIDLNYLHNSARCYVNIKSSGAIKSSIHKPDDVMESLNPWLPENYCSSEEEFSSMCQKENHELIFGKVIHEFKDKNRCTIFPNDEVHSSYKITHCDLTNAEFKAFHARFETYVIWFIDGANFIDLEDEKWDIFYVYEEVEHPQTLQVYTSPIGYCTVYKFFAYPENIRARISQFFILPSHHRRGIGSTLYKTVFETLKSDPKVIDITVEEPTSEFQRIRDIHDGLLLWKLLKERDLRILSLPMKRLFSVIKELKIGKKQSNRLYDILCGLSTINDKVSYQEYLTNIKNRIERENKEKINYSKCLRQDSQTSPSFISDQVSLLLNEFKSYTRDIEISIEYIKNRLDK